MDVTLHLPVKRFVLKYCDKRFCKDTAFGRSWRLNMREKEAKFLWALLERTPNRYEKYAPDEAKLHILVPSNIACQRGAYLSQESIDLFNEYIKQCIVDEISTFHTGIKCKMGLKMIDKVTLNQYQAERTRVLRITPGEAHKFFWQKSMIYDFLAQYDITEDEISAESIVKHLQRHTPAHYTAS